MSGRGCSPFLPFAAEEVWSWWHDGSIHRTTWPAADRIAAGGTARPLEVAELADIQAIPSDQAELRVEVTL